MTNVGIITNANKDENMKTTKRCVKWLNEHNLNVITSHEFNDDFKNIDFLIVLGGDGTLLNAAKHACEYSIPILGVNLGNLGFLTEVEVGDLNAALENIISKKYFIEERMMLKCDIIRDDTAIASYNALNDCVITRGAIPRIIDLYININNEPAINYSSDGLIISTPTGSTAYSFSAGGPILMSDVHAIIITPICPHSLNSRSILVNDMSSVKVVINDDNTNIMVTIDGQIGLNLLSGDIVSIRKSDLKCDLIKFGKNNFFKVLENKLNRFIL